MKYYNLPVSRYVNDIGFSPPPPLYEDTSKPLSVRPLNLF